MNANDLAPVARASRLHEAVATACGRIAPTWPLDRLIAVNPYWGWLAHRAPEAAAQLGLLHGTRLTAARSVAQQAWQQGVLQTQHLQLACEAALDPAQVPAAVARLASVLLADDAADAPVRKLPLLAELATGRLHAALSAADAVTHQISQHCAAFFDDGQAQWHPERAQGLWGSWRQALAADAGLAWPGGRAGLARALADWPDDPSDALSHGLARLPLPPEAWDAYLTALLLSVNGWASWCAYRQWQARLNGREDDALLQLLAIRLAWELLLADAQGLLAQQPAWAADWAAQPGAAGALQAAQADDWLLQHALELAHQQQLARGLRSAAPAPQAAAALQAVFCIDVRSERFRRALEAADEGIRTRGFAGFFGLPLAYSPAGSALVRPQLPGLLAPAIQVSEEGAGLASVLRHKRQRSLQWRERWAGWRGAAASGFSFVETCGPAYALKLLARSRPGEQRAARWEDTGLAAPGKPRLPATLTPAAGADMAAGILGAMGLAGGFAPLVLLAGHGSRSDNNPHAAGLDCGACGGQAGDINARVLAGLLNDLAVRQALAARGIDIPAATHFIAGQHDTTTDEMVLFDVEDVPPALAPMLARLRTALARAGAATRRERAPGLGLDAAAPEAALLASLRRRANDWSQVRPEWGLADNASFIVAPRQRTRHLRLDGRAFLHDYDWRQDPELAVLTLIMTAPMVVTNWINLQYHASTVDNARYGSGNKLLHNVVGGHLGVFEGNGGDLRIGLPRQSLHDGSRWRHTPLRLSVFIEAPAAAIESVMGAHAVVRQLVDNGWLHLLRIDPADGRTEAWRAGGWHALAAAQEP